VERLSSETQSLDRADPGRKGHDQQLVWQALSHDEAEQVASLSPWEEAQVPPGTSPRSSAHAHASRPSSS
jgi:hypothetical protein